MITWILSAAAVVAMNRPADIVDLATIDASIKASVRYASAENFAGERIRGYNQPKCLLTKRAANALARVQADLQPFGHSLLVYDCYRPQTGVDHFVEWAKRPVQGKQKKRYFPEEDKKRLFKRGYIASKSGHSRASTVDLTLVPIDHQVTGKAGSADCRQVDQPRDDSVRMGTTFDCFDDKSSTAAQVDEQARRNRLLLKTLMEKHGFKNYSREWWHYTLKDEPYPKTYFGFPVE